jgi:long-chain acyl-CoA synthetase
VLSATFETSKARLGEAADGSDAMVDLGLQPSPEVTHGLGRLALGDLLRRSARRFPEKVAVATPSREITYGQLDELANPCSNRERNGAIGSLQSVPTASTSS